MLVSSPQILQAPNLFLLICLPFLTLNKSLICLNSTVWPSLQPLSLIKGSVVHHPSPPIIDTLFFRMCFHLFSKPKVSPRRLGSFRHNIRLYRPCYIETDQKQCKTICHFYKMCPYVCGLWFYENRHMGKDKASSDMTSGCHSKSHVR